MIEFSNIIYEFTIWLFLLYSLAIFLIYSWIGIYAFGAVLKYKRKNTFTDYKIIASNPNAPTFSLIAPAYNEGMTIVDNVRSLLSLYYQNLEIIIVNDGSKDDSIERLIATYDLERISFFVQGELETKPIRGIYKSKNPAFKRLIVVDKENGGKADALNVGINISSGEYIVCIDVDCILEQDAILKLAKPFLEQTDKRVIACGGVIRLANNCKIENGKITEVNLPRTMLGRSQALEYIRAFVLGRMAWSRASGLILISGAFGAFDREIVLACGGYDKNTVGEDMELVVRMRRYMEETKQPYEVVNIPDPLCWTEVPESKEVLKKQRNRWMRGTMETLWKHRKMMFNPKYGKLGMISLPYWFLFEFLGPIVEFLGYVIFILFFILGIINWQFFFVLFALVIASGILYSIYAILVDFISRQVYTKRKDFVKLVVTAIVEPFYFHPITVRAGVSGCIDYFRKKTSWGEMTRQGFNQSVKNLPLKERMLKITTAGLASWGSFMLIFILLSLIGTMFEWLWYKYNFEAIDTSFIARELFYNNILFSLQLGFILGVLYLLINYFNESLAKKISVVLLSLVGINQYLLFIYFSESHNMLGADLLYYNSQEIQHILMSSGILSFKTIALLFLLILGTIVPFWIASKTPLKHWTVSFVAMTISFGAFFVPKGVLSDQANTTDFERTAGKSKWAYFLNENLDEYLQTHREIVSLFILDETIDFDRNLLDVQYPFWKEENTPDFLGNYFNKASVTPNLVLITIEGLGHAYSSPNGYIGNFTPFIDSLAQKSLYWENNLSSSGRTFSAIPTITGSLPFAKNGFLEIEVIPNHFNLFNVLNKNGFETGFFYGGNASFDNMKSYLEYSEVDNIIEQWSFDPPYKKLPENNGESWGFEDQAVFSKMLEIQKINNTPYFDMILTLSTHNPFLINNSKKYEEMFEKRISSGAINQSQKTWAKNNKKQLVSVLNLDDALKKYFIAYSQRSDFKNTIFIITGDHSMPEIQLETKIDRYHVPLIIYSPLLKETKHFKNRVSHFDIAPSILAFYRENYHLNVPKTVAWIGKGLSAEPSDAIPMMQSKTQLIDFISGKYHLVDKELFVLESNLNENLVYDKKGIEKIQKKFQQFKLKNTQFYTSKKLIPDSVYTNFMQ